jgi:hypothetical protein
MDYFIYVNGALTSQSILTDLSKFPAANVNDWSNYVYRVAAFLHAPPYNVQYFQIWNEALVGNDGFWYGGNNEYMQKVHLPGAQAVHAAGGRVVYGGWPDISTPSVLLNLLDANNAWGSIDVLDIHYYNVGDLQTLRSGADTRGYTNVGVWQTEIGFTTDYTYIPNYYSRALYWNLSNNWTQDKYQAFYFANWATTSTSDPAYHRCLWSGNNLDGHGIVLANLASVLGGTNQLSQFPGVTCSPALSPQVWPSMSSMETFAYSSNIAIVVHLSRTDFTNNPSLSLYVPVAPSRIANASRVDLSGVTSNVTSQVTAQGVGTQLTVSTRDAVGSQAETWNGAANMCEFYVLLRTVSTNLALNRPVTVSSTDLPGNAAGYAVDGNLSTRWSSAYSDPQWIYVDLGATYNLSRVKLTWHPQGYGKSYKIQVSPDATTWTDIYSTTTGQGTVDDLTGLSGTGRYVRMYGTQRGTQWGYSLYEFEVYGALAVPAPTGLTATGGKGQVVLEWDASTNATSYNLKRAASSDGPFTALATVTNSSCTDTTGVAGAVYYYVVSALGSGAESPDSSPVSAVFFRNVALNQPASASSSSSSSYPAANAVDGNLATQWLSQSSDPQWLYVDLGTNYSINGVSLNWGPTAAKAYQIHVSTNAINWVTVYSTNNAAGGTENISFAPKLARYVRLYGIQRLTSSGYALSEFQVFGMLLPVQFSLAPAGGLMVLSWFADGNFSLWDTTNLADPASWYPLTNAVQGTNVLSVTVDPASPSQFFQLRPQ